MDINKLTDIRISDFETGKSIQVKKEANGQISIVVRHGSKGQTEIHRVVIDGGTEARVQNAEVTTEETFRAGYVLAMKLMQSDISMDEEEHNACCIFTREYYEKTNDVIEIV